MEILVCSKTQQVLALLKSAASTAIPRPAWILMVYQRYDMAKPSSTLQDIWFEEVVRKAMATVQQCGQTRFRNDHNCRTSREQYLAVNGHHFRVTYSPIVLIHHQQGLSVFTPC
jgi:hypothetical protein